jgi:hypothetical protein
VPILRSVETPDPLIESAYVPEDEGRAPSPLGGTALWGIGERMTWIAGLVLALSAFTGW